MDIDSNFSAARANGTPPLRRTTRATKVLTDGSIFSQLSSMQQTLESLPESRPDAVLRAKELIADSDYPPEPVQQTLALHLAVQLTDDPSNSFLTMKSRELITRLLNEWLEMTHREAHAIKMGKWSDLAKIQKAKADLQGPLTSAIEQWKTENPSEVAVYPFRDEVNRLLAVEAQNSELLAVRKREVREKILLLEQALDDLRRLHASYDQSSKAA